LAASSAGSTAEPGPPGGRYLTRSTTATALDGTPPRRFVVAAFDSQEKAKAWYESPKTKELTAARLKSAKSNAFIVEGFAN
jgi:uncharacterized protein (DUF1330 family)